MRVPKVQVMKQSLQKWPQEGDAENTDDAGISEVEGWRRLLMTILKFS